MHSVFVSFEMSASATRVWQVVGDPGQMAVWHPGIVESAMTDRTRRAVLGNGMVVLERIEKHDDAAMAYEYVMTDAPFPLRDYRCTLAVKSSGDGRCTVEWSSTYETDDEAAADMSALVRSVYVDGLTAVRAMI